MLKNRSFGQKLILFTTTMLFIASIIIGFSSYIVARNALIEQGKTILQNGVKSAILLIDELNNEVIDGTLTLEEAQERLKISLLGPKNPDGTRQNDTPVDFGKNGYYIIYSQMGIELMHPTLEGQNVWYFKDKGNTSNPFYLVQDKIQKAKLGGGYTEYTWEFPYSKKLGKKIVYSELDPNWGWVVTAGSYISDFDAGAFDILKITMITMIFVILLGFIFATRYIYSITKPLTVVVEAMKHAEDGEYRPVDQVEVYDELGKLIHGFNAMIQSIDIAHKNLIKKDDQLLKFAYYDALSGLPNAYYFKKEVSERLESIKKPAAMLLVDIKDFNIINSIYGTTYGDKIIEFLGNTIIEENNMNSFVARIGGNEFAIWIEAIEENLIVEKIDRLIDRIKAKIQSANFISHIEFYTCLVEVDATHAVYDHIYKKASTALQYSKNKGHIKVTKYKEEMYLELERESTILTLAEAAMHSNQFEIHYQNKVDIRTQKVVGIESLSRWKSPELGFISPAEFIPLFYKSNLMEPFSNIVLTKVLDDFPEILKIYGEDILVSINISPVSFFNDNFEEHLKKEIERRGLNPHNLILEITEDVFISDFEIVKSRIDALKKLGVKISLDDFGTGYSSLNYLSKIKFDEIKVDKSFVDRVHLDETSYSLFNAIVKIAKGLDCEVVAEGVESEEQVQVIQNSGCFVIQGYVYSKPKLLSSL